MKQRLHMFQLPGATVLLVSLGLLAGCDKQASLPTGAPVLAKVGNQAITAEDLKNEAARLRSGNQSVPEKADLLQQMVNRLQLVERAKIAKLDSDHATRRLMDGVLITKLREAELEEKLAKVEVSEDELRKAYEADLAKFTKSEKVRLAMLFQEINATMSDAKKVEIRQRMEEGLQKASAQPAAGGRGPAAGGFGAVAVDYSEDQVSRYRGGDIGWLDVGNFTYRWPKPVLEAGYALEKGKMSGVIETESGLYVIMKTDYRESAATPFKEASSGLRQTILAQKRKGIEEGFLKQTSSMVPSEIHPEALAAVDLPPATKPAASPDSIAPPSLLGGPVSTSTTSEQK